MGIRLLLPTAQGRSVLAALAVISAASAIHAADVKFVRIPEGGLQPQVALDAQGTLNLLYFKGLAGAGDLYLVRRATGQETFSEPLRVNSQSGSAIATGSIRGGQLAVGKNGRVHVAWNGSSTAEPKGPGKNNNPMLYSRLNDSATGFDPQRSVIESAYNLDGGGCVAADPQGNVFVSWHSGDGTGEINRRVMLVRSHDDGATFDKEVAIDAERYGVCGCCGLKAFADSAGDLFILYRSAREGVNRDMQLLFAQGAADKFKNLRLDTWNVATCPMSSEAFAEAGDAVFAAWETAGQVQFARIDPKSGSPGKAIKAPGSADKRRLPAIAASRDGRLLLVWTEGTGWEKGGSLAWQEYDAQGKPTSVRGRKDGIPVWSFAAAYAEPDGTFVVLY